MLPTLTLRTGARRYPGADDIVVHRAPLRPADWIWHDSGPMLLPLTSPARTIVDLVLDRQEPSYLARATAEALHGGLLTPAELRDAAEHRKSRTAALQARTEALLDAAA